MIAMPPPPTPSTPSVFHILAICVMMLAIQVVAREEAASAMGAAFFMSCRRFVMKKSCELLRDLMAWNGGGVVKWSMVRVGFMVTV